MSQSANRTPVMARHDLAVDRFIGGRFNVKEKRQETGQPHHINVYLYIYLLIDLLEMAEAALNTDIILQKCCSFLSAQPAAV